MRVGFLGECMLEVIDGRSAIGYGGDTLNAAIYFSRLNSGRHYDCYYLTALGDDPLSQDMKASWENEKIKTDYVVEIPSMLPGLYLIDTDEKGERSFFFWRSESAARQYLKFPIFFDVVNGGRIDVLFLSGISLGIFSKQDKENLLMLVQQFKAGGGFVVFDNNFRHQVWKDEPAAGYYNRLLAYVDIALLTEDDERLVHGFDSTEQLIQHYQASMVPEVVVKRGAEPCIIVHDNDVVVVPSFQVSADSVVDTTAAGDSFAAAYLYSRLSGVCRKESAVNAHKLASKVIQFPGALIPLEAMPDLVFAGLN